MNRKLNFTKRALEAIEPPTTGRDTYSDTGQAGLKLRVSTGGAKTFTLVKKVQGKTRFLALGPFPALSVAEARRMAGEKGAQLAKGEDLSRPKPEVFTFGELWEAYMTGHAQRFKKTWGEDQRLHDTLFSQWDRKPLADITRKTAAQLHARITKNNGPYAANRAIETIRRAFNYGIDTLELNTRNPAAKVKRNRERSRERFLDADELRRFFEALNDEQTPQDWRDFFSLCLWTAARRANVQSLQWAHLDLQAGLWAIPGEEFKTGSPFTCVLTAPAVEILTRRQAESKGAKYVFPSRSQSGHVCEPRKPWKDILARAGLEDVHLHDLRRTLASWQAAAGASLPIIGRTLGHKSQAATAVYARLNMDPVRASLDTATAGILATINEGPHDE